MVAPRRAGCCRAEDSRFLQQCLLFVRWESSTWDLRSRQAVFCRGVVVWGCRDECGDLGKGVHRLRTSLAVKTK